MSGGTNSDTGVRGRVAAVRERYGLQLPILMAPMAGACPPELAIAVPRSPSGRDFTELAQVLTGSLGRFAVNRHINESDQRRTPAIIRTIVIAVTNVPVITRYPYPTMGRSKCPTSVMIWSPAPGFT